MKKWMTIKAFCVITFFLLLTIQSEGQQISKEEMLFLTPEWKGERFEDGRPKVSEAILERMKAVTHEEAWAVLKNEGYKYQYAVKGIPFFE